MRSGTLLFCLLVAAAQAQWTQLPDFPGTARDDAAIFSANDIIYVGTGMEEGWGLTNDWFAYTWFTESWAPVASLPASGRQYCNGFQLDNDLGYLFGGLDADGPLNELWSYDPQTDSWTERTPLPGPGRYACAVLVFDTQAFVCGGMLEGGIPTNEVWRYDRITDSWTQRNPMPGPGRHRAASMGLQLIGGADSTFQAMDDVLSYDHINDGWQNLPPLPEPRFGASAGEPMLFCGASSLSENHDTVLLMDYISGNWSSTTIPPFPGGPRKGGVTYAELGSEYSIHLYGLGVDGQTRYNDWWMYSHSTGMAEQRAGTIKVFPNPVSAQVLLELPSHWTSVQYTLLDGTGRMVDAGSQPGTLPLDVQSLPAGRYELLLVHDDERLRASFIKLP